MNPPLKKLKSVLLILLMPIAIQLRGQPGDPVITGVSVLKVTCNGRSDGKIIFTEVKDQNPAISWYNDIYSTINATTGGLFDKRNADQIIKAQGDSVLYAANVCANAGK